MDEMRAVGARARAALMALLAVAMVAPLFAADRAEATAAPVAAFDWSMAERFGPDRNGDGLTDYVDGASDHATGYDATPPSWRVDLNACGSTPGASFQWEIVDQPNPAAPISVQGGPGCDEFWFDAPEEGAYRLDLVTTLDGVASAPARREVVVQDWLIVAMGDSYGSGEGAPDIPIDTSALQAAEQAWADYDAAVAEVFRIESSMQPFNDAVASYNEAVYEWDNCESAEDCAFWAITTGLRLASVVAEAVVLGVTVAIETITDAINAVGALLDAARAEVDRIRLIADSVTGSLSATWQSAQCHRSANSGSAQAARRLEQLDPKTSVTFVHLACSGATMAYGMLGWYAGTEPVGENTDAACNSANRPAGCVRPQIDVAKELVGNREVDAAYISIGGNDAHFADILIACIVQEPCSQPNPVSDPGQFLSSFCPHIGVDFALTNVLNEKCRAFFGGLPPLMDTADELIEEGISGDTRPPIDPKFPGLAVGYQRLDTALVGTGKLIPETDTSRVYLSEYVDAVKRDDGAFCDWDSMGFDAIPGMSATESAHVDDHIVPTLYGAIEQAAGTHGWTFVDGIYEGFTNHGYCAQDHYIVRAQETFLIEGRYHGMVHPNANGYSVYADKILADWQAAMYPTGSLSQPRRPDQAAYADAGGPYAVDEGSSVTLTNDSWDSDGDSTTFAWSQDRAGHASLSSATAPAPSLGGLDDTSGTVRVTVSDADGSRTDTAPFEVRNVAPSVATGSPVSLAEGEAYSGSFTYTDPGALDTHTATVDHGDGTGATPAATGGLASVSHTWVDEGTYTLGATVTDDDGGVGSASRTVTVTNAPAAIDPIVAPIDPVLINTGINASATFSDPGVGDTHTGTWDWGDGTTSPATITEAGGAGSVADAHTYTATGIYTVTLTLDDGDPGGVSSAIHQYVVVYDPAGGFATGGGWFDSPSGAYTPGDATDADVVGQAHFAFISKYAKGATIPTGATSFRFAAGDLDFASTSYDWMVISGDKATYRGTGTVNGEAGYKFVLSAVDGTPDRIRVRIWDAATDEVVYDNQAAEGIDAPARTAIGAGSVSIHPPPSKK